MSVSKSTPADGQHPYQCPYLKLNPQRKMLNLKNCTGSSIQMSVSVGLHRELVHPYEISSESRTFDGQHWEAVHPYVQRYLNPQFQMIYIRNVYSYKCPPRFSAVRVAHSWLFCVVFCRSLFVLFCFWPWHCRVTIFDYHLVSSSFYEPTTSDIIDWFIHTNVRI
jgi:hypothetical protein